MKWLWRILAGLVLLLIVAAGAAYIWRLPLAGWIAEGQLEKLGLEDPDVTVTTLTMKKAAFTLEAPQLSGEASVDYEFGELWRDRRVRDIVVSRLKGTLVLTETGEVSVVGLSLPQGDGEPQEKSGYPFRSLTVGEANVALLTPEGEGRLTAAIAIDPEEGGEIVLELTGDRLGVEALTAEAIRLSANIDLSADGPATGKATLQGDVLTAQTIARNLDLQLDGAAGDWRPLLEGKLPDSGRLSLNISSASIGAETTAVLQSLADGAPPFQTELDLVTLTGSVDAMIEGGVLTARIGDAPIEARSSEGIFLRLEGIKVEPLLVLSEDSADVAARLSTELPQFAGDVVLLATQEGTGPWELALAGHLPRGEIAGLTLNADEVAAQGSYDRGVLTLETQLAGRLQQARLGALTVTDAPIRAQLPVRADFNTSLFSIPGTEGTTVVVGGAKLRSTNGSMRATLGPTELIPEAGRPFLSASLGEANSLEGGVGVRLSRISAQAGETQIRASSLRGAASLDFDNQENITALTMSLTGGNGQINDTLSLQNIVADGQVRVLSGDAEGELSIKGVTITEAREAPRVASMKVSGPVKLKSGRVGFDLAVAGPNGTPLGKVKGQHTLETGRGHAEFDSGELRFVPGGLQPSKLLPPLIGIISKATGSLHGSAVADWGNGGLKTSAVISPTKLSFSGPGITVERTSELTGVLTFSNLFPVTTDGMQIIEVGSIDFGSIALPNGEVRFELPGDDTLVVEEAVFPLFDGQMIAEKAVIGFDGGSVATLRAEDLDLGAILSFLNVKGLTGAGRVEGTLPIVFDRFAVRIENGVLRATSPGVIEFTGPTAEAAAQSNQGARLAFDALEFLRFSELEATINGRLDGDLDFKFTFKGESEVDLDGDGGAENVNAPIIFRANVEVPLISLINQARLSRDTRLQIEAAREQLEKERNGPEE
ncbi:YdbH domain-containing protein [Parvularcula marina]|uniref:intermembrane phospholipid transport protein YdbH family protein n=1 Tax=Parvularcula marina TaxID=2292771 RepID=UPI003517B18E